MNKIYLIIKQGVYRHEILGAYTVLQDAMENAEGHAKEERKHDGYHDFHVESIPLNTAVEDCTLVGYYDCVKDGVIWKEI